jgi:hypothetical protein
MPGDKLSQIIKYLFLLFWPFQTLIKCILSYCVICETGKNIFLNPMLLFDLSSFLHFVWADTFIKTLKSQI